MSSQHADDAVRTEQPVPGTGGIPEAPVPSTFLQYLRSFGPGIVVVLTWLGAGDLVDASVAGANYGYALMWALALSLIMRFGLVSLIAKFQLMNQAGVSVLGGYQRIHRWAPMVLGIAVVVSFHLYNSYYLQGTGNALTRMTGVGNTTIWAAASVVVAWYLTHRALYGPVEKVMMVILAILVITLVGSAIMVGPDPVGLASGVFGFAIPAQIGPFGSMLVAVSLIGAVGGSVANLLYPYFMQAKGWTRPKHRKVQMYDLLLGIVVLIVIDLAIWILGAEVLNPRGIVVESVDDMAGILSELYGNIGGFIFYLGVFGATFSSTVGSALGGPLILKDAIRLTWPDRVRRYPDQNRDPIVRVAYYFIFVAALVWTIPGMPGFIFMTVVVNALQMPLLPLVSIGLLIILNRTDLMGDKKNNILENLFLIFLTALAIWGAWQVYSNLAATIGGLDRGS